MKNFSPKSVIRQESTAMEKETVLSLRDVFFRYDKNGKDILKGVNLDVSKGEFFCLLGGNGAGKTKRAGSRRNAAFLTCPDMSAGREN